jgi:thymidylate synthase ThyX
MKDYKVQVQKVTEEKWMRIACEKTFLGKSKQTMDSIARQEHSPLRTQLYWVDLENIPLFVGSHLVRHHVGSQPYMLTHRTDRKGGEDLGRNTPTDLGLMVNAQGLIDISKDRLCFQASKETREIFESIKSEVHEIDPNLAKYMVKKCVYRNGLCNEDRCCGYVGSNNFRDELDDYLDNFSNKQLGVGC